MSNQNDNKIKPQGNQNLSQTINAAGSEKPVLNEPQYPERPQRGPERLLRDGHFWFAGDSIIIHDEEGRIIDCNQQITESLGYSRGELLCLSIVDIALLAEGNATSPWKRIAPWGKLMTESTFVRKEGTSFPVEVCVRHEVRAGHSLFIAIIRDITRQKEAESRIKKLLAEVQEERGKLSMLIDSISDEIWYTDEHLNISLLNPAARSSFGQTNDEMKLEDLIRGLEIFRPDGTPRPETEAPPVRALSGEMVKNVEEIVRNPSTGAVYYRQVSSSPVRDADGKIVGTVSVVRDITDQKNIENLLKESQQEQGSLFDILPIGVSVLDAAGNVIRTNRSLERILGISEEDLTRGLHRNRRYLREDGTSMPVEEMPSLISIQEQRFVENVEIGVVKEDGAIVWTLVSAMPLPHGGAVVVTRDFTRQKRTIEILRQRKAEVEDANAALRVLLRQREHDKKEVEQAVMDNISKLVMPHLDMLGATVRSAEINAYLDIIRAALNNIVSSFSTDLAYKIGSLSPKEVQIAHMVREGRQDKEIAGLLRLSEPTIRAHRRNIRKKLGLTNQKINLRAFLSQK